MSVLSDAIAQIAADAARATSVVESTKAVVNGIRAQVADLTAQLSTSNDVSAACAKLAELHTILNNSVDDLAEATCLNTVAAVELPAPSGSPDHQPSTTA